MSDPMQAHKLLLLNLAEFYGHNLSENQLQMYARVIAHQPLDLLQAAIVQLTSDPAVTRMPLPAAIVARIAPPETDESLARTAAAMILSSVGKHGWTNPERARAFMGELAWKVVELQGGWTQICQTLDEGNITTFQAQWRELALSTLKRSRAGTLGIAPGLAKPLQGMSLAGLMKELPK